MASSDIKAIMRATRFQIRAVSFFLLLNAGVVVWLAIKSRIQPQPLTQFEQFIPLLCLELVVLGSLICAALTAIDKRLIKLEEKEGEGKD